MRYDHPGPSALEMLQSDADEACMFRARGERGCTAAVTQQFTVTLDADSLDTAIRVALQLFDRLSLERLQQLRLVLRAPKARADAALLAAYKPSGGPSTLNGVPCTIENA